jgi:anti-anti-sigma regulatory factor
LPAIVRFTPQPATLSCSGDEDVTTQGCRRGALSRALTAQRDLHVDLRELHFADASLMLDLVMVSGRLRKGGHRMVLHAPQPQISRLIEAVGLHRLPGVTVQATAAPALA